MRMTSIGALMLLAMALSAAEAQTAPPAQTKQPGQKSMVVNPTQAECQKGWSSNLKWTKPEFDRFCATLNKSK